MRSDREAAGKEISGQLLFPPKVCGSHPGSADLKHHGDTALELRVSGGKRGRFFGIC